MLKNLKESIMENIDSITIAIVMMNGGYYRPITL